MAEEYVVLDSATAQRMGRAVRQLEAQGMVEPAADLRLQGSIEAIVVPRSGPDGSGFYTCDIYVLDDGGTSYTQVATGQYVRELPATL